MGLNLISRFGFGRRSVPASSPRLVSRASVRPQVEGLEDRLVMSSSATMNLPLAVQSLSVKDGALNAVISIAGQTAGEATIAVKTEAPDAGAGAVQAAQADCPILNLELGPINLNLLGLHVETSEICLDVTAHEGEGLLGDLLCGLSGGLDLGGILNNLGANVDQFLNQLDRLLDRVLAQPMNVDGVLGADTGGAAVTPAQNEDFCDVLNLSLGPVDLNLLGLQVELDDCNNGPVTVDVTADPNGGLLGGLLCGLSDGLNLGGLNLGGLIRRVDRLIDRLGDIVDRLDQLPNLTRQLTRLTTQLERLAERLDDLNDLDRLLGGLDRIADRLDKVADRLDDLKQLDKAIDQLDKAIDQLDKVLKG